MNTFKLALLASVLAATPATAMAQAVGATIYGNDGAPIGTVARVDGEVIVIDTGTHEAPVPATTFYDTDKGKTLNLTKAQLDTMMAQKLAEAEAKRDAALVQGAAVMSLGGKPVGTLDTVDLAADKILLDSGQGLLMLKKEYFAIGPEGNLMVLYTSDQIASAAAGANTAASAGDAAS